MAGEAAPTLRTNCPACNRALTRHEQFAGGFCNDWQCRRHRTEAACRAERRELERRAGLERDAEAERRDDAALRQAPLIFVAWYRAGLEPVPLAQRQQLRAHLMALQSEVDSLLARQIDDPAMAAAGPVPESGATQARSEVDAVLGQVCARCTGHCCQTGNGQHAYLDAAALLRARLDWPEASHAQIVDAYLAAIPPVHQARSCAFHGKAGCALPRERRAEVCNSWECPGLIEARRHAEENKVHRFYVFSHDREHPGIGGFAPPPGKPRTG